MSTESTYLRLVYQTGHFTLTPSHTPSSSLYQNGVRESWEEAQEQVPNIMFSRDTGIPNILSLLCIIGRLERSNTGHMLVGV